MAFLRSAVRFSVYKKYGLFFDPLQNNFGKFQNFHFKQVALKSSAASSTLVENAANAVDPPKDPLDTSFDDPRAAFKSKTNFELVRAYVVYALCSIEYLVTHNMQVRIPRNSQ